ncbi:hypothetical protein VCHA34P131_110127 [Vibrio chagasii]|nr:hypothetical protein VCHA34P131_110127 [Vibrio chagasii]CAH6860749.1 hypothetical protein VCHA34P121_210047 [Vibrio chagasii]
MTWESDVLCLVELVGMGDSRLGRSSLSGMTESDVLCQVVWVGVRDSRFSCFSFLGTRKRG